MNNNQTDKNKRHGICILIWCKKEKKLQAIYRIILIKIITINCGTMWPPGICALINFNRRKIDSKHLLCIDCPVKRYCILSLSLS